MRISLSFILTLTLVTASAHPGPNIHKSAIPNWLIPIHPDLNKKPAQRDISDGYYYDLLEEQTNLSTSTEYTHYIKHIINQSGVQNGSEISVTFSPQFQQVIFHKISILREDGIIDQLQPDQIKVVQEETEADEFQYNGLKRAYLTLKDIRKNDRIEVSFSIVGFNPVFAGKFSEESTFSCKTAVSNYYKTILTTPSRKLNIVSINNAPQPTLQQKGNNLVYLWDNTPLSSAESTAETPVWFNNSPTAYISEYADWSEVVKWGVTTFNNYNYPIPVNLRQKIAGWAATSKNNKDLFANLATRFVQNDVRYLGLEIGANTHRPHPPTEVYNQRFGDCKDKALLLSIILRQQGIPAFVALVSTTTRSQLASIAPSPGAFDHAITAIQRPNGEFLFVDPTRAQQRGELTNLYIPAYGFALVLKTDEKTLRPITPGRVFDYTIIEKLDARFNDTSRYTINSVYSGGAADDMRDTYAETSIKDLEEKNLRYYASEFEDIRQEAPISFSDDSIRNEFRVNKSYAIPHLWNTDEKGKKSFDFSARVIGQALSDPAHLNTNAPMALPYPCNIHYTLNITLPENWDFGSGALHIKNDSYQFDFVPDVNGNQMTLYYTLRTFKDHIPAKEIQQYKTDYKKLDDMIFFQLYKNSTGDERSDDAALPKEKSETESSISAPDAAKACWPAIWLTFFFSLFFSRLFVWLNRRSEETLYAPGSGYPLGGWLILLGISIATGLFFNLYAFFSSNYYSNANWEAYGNIGGHSLQYVYLGKMAIQLSFIAASAASFFWFLKKRDIFPRMFIWHAGILLSGQLLLILLFHVTPIPTVLHDYKDSLTADLIRTSIYAAIWIFYILRSDQVKSTFLEPHPTSSPHS